MISDDPERRYRRDPVFKLFVDTIHALLRRAEMSPSEVREGAMLACIHFEMNRTNFVRALPPEEEDAEGVGDQARQKKTRAG